MNSAYDTDDDRYAPDPDAASTRIECDRDNEADAVTSDVRNLSAQDASCTQGVTCPTCGGSGYVQMGGNDWRKTCPTCHGTGRQSDAHSACGEGTR